MRIITLLTITSAVLGLPFNLNNFKTISDNKISKFLLKFLFSLYFSVLTFYSIILHLDLLLLKIQVNEEIANKLANVGVDLIFLLQQVLLRLLYLLSGNKLYTILKSYYGRRHIFTDGDHSPKKWVYYYWTILVIWVFTVILVVKGYWTLYTIGIPQYFHGPEFRQICFIFLPRNNFNVLLIAHFIADLVRASVIAFTLTVLIITYQMHSNSVNKFCREMMRDLHQQETGINTELIFIMGERKTIISKHYVNSRKIDNLILKEMGSIQGQICAVLVPIYIISAINLLYKGFTGFSDVFHNVWEAILEAIGNSVAIFFIVFGGHDLKCQVCR